MLRWAKQWCSWCFVHVALPEGPGVCGKTSCSLEEVGAALGETVVQLVFCVLGTAWQRLRRRPTPSIACWRVRVAWHII